MDRISELPDFILHHILSYLTTREAAQTGVISKRWQYVWETFPVLDCKECYFGENLGLHNPKKLGISKDERRKIFNQRLKFMSYINEKLLRIRKENLSMKKFILRITLVSKDLAPRVDKWMELLADVCIQELDLCIETEKERLHDLSKILSTMESLTVLKLSGSIQLSSSLGRNAVKLHTLVKLHLHEVSIDEDTIRDLIFSCRSMKVFSMLYCFGFENLEICDHNKLERVVVMYRRDGNFKLKKLSIKVRTVVELYFSNIYNGSCDIIVSSVCQNLKGLYLYGISIKANWLQSMLTSFPLLEHLLLDDCVLQEVMKLSSQALKKICIFSCEKLVEAEFDTPNLHSFEYCGNTMPHLYSNSVADYRKAKLDVDIEDMDRLWFIRLNNFLRDIHFQDVTFIISGEAISFNTEDYTGMQFPPFELNNMKLVMASSTSINYASLLDGLLWNLRPRVLSLVLDSFASESVKDLLICLGAEEPYCYCSENLVCWCHSLKEIKLIDDVIGLKRDSLLNVMTLDNFTNCLNDWVSEAQKKELFEQVLSSSRYAMLSLFPSPKLITAVVIACLSLPAILPSLSTPLR